MLWLIPVVLILIVSFGCFLKCFYSANTKPQDPYSLLRGQQYLDVKDIIYACTRKMDEAPFEAVSIRSYDGTKLYGRYYHHKDGAPVKIFFHGYHSMSLRDGAGGYGMAKQLGFNFLAVDQRAHGESSGHVITFGIKEQEDCRCWAEYAANRFGKDVPIILSGLSMGAATVIMAAALPLPESVVCVLADCPYSSPKKIVSKVSQQLGFPAWLSYPFLWLGALLFGGFRLGTDGAEKSAGQSKIPILLLHGEDDRLVPCQMSADIHHASKGCTRLETFPGAGHGLSYMTDAPRYEAVCLSFFRSIPSLAVHLDIVDSAQRIEDVSVNI